MKTDLILKFKHNLFTKVTWSSTFKIYQHIQWFNVLFSNSLQWYIFSIICYYSNGILVTMINFLRNTLVIMVIPGVLFLWIINSLLTSYCFVLSFQMAMFTIAKSWRHRKNIKIFDHYDDNIDLVNKKSLHRSRLDLYENDLEKVNCWHLWWKCSAFCCTRSNQLKSFIWQYTNKTIQKCITKLNLSSYFLVQHGKRSMDDDVTLNNYPVKTIIVWSSVTVKKLQLNIAVIKKT